MKRIWEKPDPIGLLLPFLLLSAWYLTVTNGRLPSYVLPSPQNTLRVMLDFASGADGLTPYSGKLPENLSASFSRVFMGFGTAMIWGLPLGFLTGRIALAKRIIDPLIHALRTIPGIGWLPVSMVWFGVGERTTVFLISLAAFFPIYLNTVQGASAVPFLLLRAGSMLGASRIDLFRTIILPASFPSVVVGLRLGMGVSWAYLVLGELTGVSEGLGAVMMDSRMMGQTEMILVSMICIAVAGMLSDRLLLCMCRWIHPSGGDVI